VSARIGRLRHRVVLERAERESDGGGGAVETWGPVAELWAMIEPRSGKETVEADRLAGSRKVDVTIRFREYVAPNMRFRFGDRVLDIRAVLDEDGRRHFLKCDCEERDL
jgi:SPP1 family predicted phage head-tail adaptor